MKKNDVRDALKRSQAVAALLDGRPEEPESTAPVRARQPIVPDFLSAETLAQRLDCSRSTIHAYVRRGILPRPLRIGELVRWKWADVDIAIESLRHQGDSQDAVHDDPYIEGLERGETEEAGN